MHMFLRNSLKFRETPDNIIHIRKVHCFSCADFWNFHLPTRGPAVWYYCTAMIYGHDVRKQRNVDGSIFGVHVTCVIMMGKGKSPVLRRCVHGYVVKSVDIFSFVKSSCGRDLTMQAILPLWGDVKIHPVLLIHRRRS